MDIKKLRQQGTYLVAILATLWVVGMPAFQFINDDRMVTTFGEVAYRPFVNVYSIIEGDLLAEAVQTMLFVSLSVLPFAAALKKVWFDHLGGRPVLNARGRVTKWSIIAFGVVLPAVFLTLATPYSTGRGYHGLLGGIAGFDLWNYYVYNGIAIGGALVASWYAFRLETGDMFGTVEDNFSYFPNGPSTSSSDEPGPARVLVDGLPDDFVGDSPIGDGVSDNRLADVRLP